MQKRLLIKLIICNGEYSRVLLNKLKNIFYVNYFHMISNVTYMQQSMTLKLVCQIKHTYFIYYIHF